MVWFLMLCITILKIHIINSATVILSDMFAQRESCKVRNTCLVENLLSLQKKLMEYIPSLFFYVSITHGSRIMIFGKNMFTFPV